MTPREERAVAQDAGWAESDLMGVYEAIDYAMSLGGGFDDARKQHLVALCQRIIGRLIHG